VHDRTLAAPENTGAISREVLLSIDFYQDRYSLSNHQPDTEELGVNHLEGITQGKNGGHPV